MGLENWYACVEKKEQVVFKRNELEKNLADGYVRLELLFCGICGSDYSIYKGRRNYTYPKTLGHEFVGRIIQLGKNSKEFKLDDLVSTDLNYRCGTCDFCLKDASHLCIENTKGLFSNRGFAKYIDIHNQYLYPVNSIAEPAVASLVEPLSCVIHAVNKTPPQANDSILVIGLGSIGTLFVFTLRKRFPNTPIKVYDRNPTKVANIVQLLGVDSISALQNFDEQFSLIYEATNSPDGVEQACELLARMGRISVMSHLDHFDHHEIIHTKLSRKDVSIFFPYLNGGTSNMQAAIGLLSNSWKAEFNPLIKIFPISELNELLLKKDKLPYNKLVVKCN